MRLMEPSVSLTIKMRIGIIPRRINSVSSLCVNADAEVANAVSCSGISLPTGVDVGALCASLCNCGEKGS
jgi:hypothetical protein